MSSDEDGGSAQREVLKRQMSHALNWNWTSGLPAFPYPTPTHVPCLQAIGAWAIATRPRFSTPDFSYMYIQVPSTESVEYSHIPGIAAASWN